MSLCRVLFTIKSVSWEQSSEQHLSFITRFSDRFTWCSGFTDSRLISTDIHRLFILTLRFSILSPLFEHFLLTHLLPTMLYTILCFFFNFAYLILWISFIITFFCVLRYRL